MNRQPCFICRRAAEWRGVVGTRFQYACSAHAGRIELLRRKHPFQSQVKVVERARSTSPRSVERPLAPGRGNFDGNAA